MTKAEQEEVKELRALNAELKAEREAMVAARERVATALDQLSARLQGERDALIKLVTEPAVCAHEQSGHRRDAEKRVTDCEAARSDAMQRFARAEAAVDDAKAKIQRLAAIEVQTVEQAVEERNLRKALQKLEAKVDEAAGRVRGASAELEEAQAAVRSTRIADIQMHMVEDTQALAAEAALLQQAIEKRIGAHRRLAESIGLNTPFTEAWNLVDGQNRRAGPLEALGLGLSNYQHSF